MSNKKRITKKVQKIKFNRKSALIVMLNRLNKSFFRSLKHFDNFKDTIIKGCETENVHFEWGRSTGKERFQGFLKEEGDEIILSADGSAKKGVLITEKSLKNMILAKPVPAGITILPLKQLEGVLALAKDKNGNSKTVFYGRRDSKG